MPNALKKTVGLILLSIQNSERVRIELNTEWNYYSYIFKIKSIGILCISDFAYLMESESMIFLNTMYRFTLWDELIKVTWTTFGDGKEMTITWIFPVCRRVKE